MNNNPKLYVSIDGTVNLNDKLESNEFGFKTVKDKVISSFQHYFNEVLEKNFYKAITIENSENEQKQSLIYLDINKLFDQ